MQPLRFSKEPLWTSTTGARSVEQFGGLVLIEQGLGVTVVDADTGEPRWTVNEHQELAGGRGAKPLHTLSGGTGHRYLVRHGDGVGVLIEYRKWGHCTPDKQECFAGPADENGLALLSGVNGSVVWQAPIIPPHPADTDITQVPGQLLRAVDDRVALVSVAAGPDPAAAKGTSATIAIDVRTGQRLWERSDGVWPEEIVDDIVLGHVSLKLPRTGLDADLTDGNVTALEFATGHKRWDLSDRYSASRLVSVAGDVAMVHGIPIDAPDKRELVIVDAGDGQEIAQFPVGGVECKTDGRALITCLSLEEAGSKLTSFDVEDRAMRTTMSGLDPSERFVTVWANRVQVVRVDGADVYTYTMDAFGNRIDERLPRGRVLTIVDDHVIVRTDHTLDGPVAMYSVL